MDRTKKHGPNFMRLALEKVSRDAIPPGGGMAAGIDFFSDPKRIRETTAAAFEWAEQVIDVMRAAPDNPHGDDEEILAGVILDELERVRSNRQ